MIQLYHFNNSNFDKNGDIILLPDLCEVTAGINRTWQLDIHHPIDEDGRWKGIVNNAVIKAPSFKPYGTQLWRIVQTEKTDAGVTAVCDPICYDAAQEVFFIQKSLNDLTAQNALASLCEGTKYTAYSDVEGRHTTRYHMANLIEILQSHENGVQKTWGGEVGFNNYELQLFKHIGGEPGTVISYGKNIAVDGFIESVNIDGVITRLIPEGYGGRLMDGTPWVDSPNIDKYPTVRIGTINYEHLRLKGDPEGDEEKDGIYYDTKAELDAALREAALEEFANGLDRPKVNLEIDVVLLENTREYAEYKNVDDLTLGDEIICRHSRLDVDTESRVIQVRFDCIREKIVFVEIGDRKRNYFDNVSSTVESVRKAITPNGDVIASQIDGFINGAKAQLRLQNTIAQKQDAIAILFEDTDPNSETFGAHALGTQGLQVSRTRQNGEWLWGTAITSEGIIANYIITGLLSDKTGSNYWDLDSGKIVANNIDVKGDIKAGSTITGSAISGGTISGGAITGGTISGAQISSQATVGQVVKNASLNQGKVEFTQTNSSAPANNSTTTIDGYGITYARPNGSVPVTSNFGASATFSNTGTNKRGSLDANGLQITDQSGSTRNGVFVTVNNIEIYQNGTKVWSAI